MPNDPNISRNHQRGAEHDQVFHISSLEMKDKATAEYGCSSLAIYFAEIALCFPPRASAPN